MTFDLSDPVDLGPDEVRVWWGDPSEVAVDDGRALALLDASERARLARLRADPDRLLFLASRVLLRTVLSNHACVAPDEWRFRADAYGRPHVAGKDRPRIAFSLSHTRGLVACAVARGDDVGVDAEWIRPRDLLAVAERFFAAGEVAALRDLPRELRTARFYELWTLKESYVKARGRGFRIALDRFAFLLEGDRAPRIEIDPEIDRRLGWRFVLYRPTAEHVVAVCARPERADDLAIVTRRLRLDAASFQPSFRGRAT